MTFRDALMRRGVPYRVSSSDENETSICCPFCSEKGESPDTRFRLGINTASGAGHCFNCGWARKRRAPWIVLRVLGAEAATELEADSPKIKTEEPICLPRGFQLLHHAYDDLDRQALHYLHKRGIPRFQVQSKNIGAVYAGRYAHRVVFPVMEGKVLRGFVARDYTGTQEPKYLNSTGEKFLYNYRVRASTIVLSEGVFKALRLEQAAAPDWASMALLGHSVTEQQLEQLLRCKTRSVVLWPDPDKAGRKGAITVCDSLLEAGFQVGVIWPVQGPADELPVSVLREHIQNAQWRYNKSSAALRLRAETDSDLRALQRRVFH